MEKVYLATTDITEEKQAEETERESRQKYRLLAENTLDVIWTMDMEMFFTYVNPAIEQMTAFKFEEWVGSHLSEHASEREFSNMRNIILREVTKGPNEQGVVFESELLRKDNSRIQVEIHGRVLFDAQGNPLCLQGTTRDISERKQAEEELQKAHALLEKRVEERTVQLAERTNEAENLNRAMLNLLEDLNETNLGLETAEQALRSTNRELESFSYSVSHDLRAPLRHIDGFVKLLLKREQKLDSTSTGYLDTIAESSARMGRLIDDLLALSRTGRREVNLQPIDSSAIVQKVVEELAAQTEGRSIEWKIGDLPVIKADSGLLRLVWTNLIGNALKYSGPCKKACIEIGITSEGCTENKGEIAFFVRDNGVGFETEYIDKLFGVFQRLHRDDEFEGTGIGLATVKRIIQRHGGRVWAEGKVGKGATFYFTMKLAKERKDGSKKNSIG